ncbi:MAG: MgtC family transporter, putative Mg2+ transporter-C (MgtC) family protein [candidate division WWE3 bacterium CSP1-7]|uniref:MgtC family transporter, putative Mg2+ transporter-C (MgtC) family protein n=1 Tax=candidate division WWE3 bacterium CSP1-7 TaxID=1576480 RepID=A0A0T5ZY46_UNCKA|nr:MAG: MgtC family transporter, putative Mg2+ transporter-C (MgtC) family protein [candidate division WWE3 bacterium CSP1-7]
MLSPWEEILRLGGALLIGFLIGLEREISRKPAGLRTHMLVSLASSLFTILSLSSAFGDGAADPTRIASQIVVGIGFVGAGVIISSGGQIKGVTTAASLWITAAMGMAMGLGEYLLAAVAAGFTLVTLLVIGVWERSLERRD